MTPHRLKEHFGFPQGSTKPWPPPCLLPGQLRRATANRLEERVQPDAHPRHPRPPERGPAFGTLRGCQPLQRSATETFTCLRSPPRLLRGTPWQIRAWQHSCASGESKQSRLCSERDGAGRQGGAGSQRGRARASCSRSHWLPRSRAGPKCRRAEPAGLGARSVTGLYTRNVGIWMKQGRPDASELSNFTFQFLTRNH